MGITGNIPTNWAYQHNNVGKYNWIQNLHHVICLQAVVGQTKRALAAAMMTTGGGLGGIVAGNIFRVKDAPGYRPALTICLAFQVTANIARAVSFGTACLTSQPGLEHPFGGKELRLLRLGESKSRPRRNDHRGKTGIPIHVLINEETGGRCWASRLS